MHLELDGKGLLYRQLYRALRRAVAEGRLPAGTRLPSTREMSMLLGVARNTVLTAYSLLCAEGMAETRHGAGTFVVGRHGARQRVGEPVAPVPSPTRYVARARALAPLVLARQPGRLRYDLHYGEPFVDPVLVTTWSRELARAALRTDPGHPSARGLPALRREIAATLARRRGIVCEPDDVVIVNGTQQALSIVARLLLDEGDLAALEDPCYQLAAQCFSTHGAELRHVPVDRCGLVVDELPAGNVRVVVVTPSHQFPLGMPLSLERRAALLDAATARQFWIVEDDYDGEFAIEGRKVPALKALDTDGRVLYVGSFSKTLFPHLRLGYVVCPPALRDDVIAIKRLLDLGTSACEQAALARLMASGAYERHLLKTAVELRRRRQALAEGIATHAAGRVALEDSGGGMHCIGWLPGFDAAGVDALVRRARSRGLGLYPLAVHHRTPPSTQGLLLGFASLSAAQIRVATRLLGECVAAAAPLARGARP
jgi:GntR family transcriptional regulator/MocR family aminotransferase